MLHSSRIAVSVHVTCNQTRTHQQHSFVMHMEECALHLIMAHGFNARGSSALDAFDLHIAAIRNHAALKVLWECAHAFLKR
jgi:hypothetical protein